MDIFKNWILSVCGATVVVSFIKIFIGNSNVKKSLNTFLAIFLLFYTVMPLGNSKANFNNINIYDNTEQTKDYTLEGYNKIVYESIKTICTENNIKVLDIEINSYIDNNGFVCINSLTVNIDDENKKELIRNEIKTRTGFEVIVE